MPYSPMGDQPLGFAPLQPFGAYPWQAYLQPGDGHWYTPGMHRIAIPPLFWVGRALCYSISCSPAIPAIWWGIQLWRLGRESPNPSAFLAWWGGVFFFRFGSIWWHNQLLSLQWVLNLVILVWWLGIRLMGLLNLGLYSSLLLIPTFILGSWVRCHHQPISPGTRM